MNDRTGDEFYIGYLPTAPSALAVWLRPRVRLLLLCATGLAAVLALSMGPFSRGIFEFGDLHEFSGTLLETPVPVLLVQRPGIVEGGAVQAQSSYVLVSTGKFGAASDVAGFDGKEVQLQGTLIFRDGQTMIELVPGSIETISDSGEESGTQPAGFRDLGLQSLRGEIVDSKCFGGVMKPGNLKPHRACATRCISGGIPPVLLVRDDQGLATYYFLVSTKGRAINGEVLPFVAEPVVISGRVQRQGDLRFLYCDPDAIQRLPTKP